MNSGKLLVGQSRAKFLMKHCSKCRELKPESEFNKNSAQPSGLENQCRVCRNSDTKRKIYNTVYHREYYFKNAESLKAKNKVNGADLRLRIRVETLEHYGRICVCCGESDIWKLQLDHINNDGHFDRLIRTGGKGGYRFYSALKKDSYPPGYQTLCANCNQRKQLLGGVCGCSEKGVTTISKESTLRVNNGSGSAQLPVWEKPRFWDVKFPWLALNW